MASLERFFWAQLSTSFLNNGTYSNTLCAIWSKIRCSFRILQIFMLTSFFLLKMLVAVHTSKIANCFLSIILFLPLFVAHKQSLFLSMKFLCHTQLLSHTIWFCSICCAFPCFTRSRSDSFCQFVPVCVYEVSVDIDIVGIGYLSKIGCLACVGAQLAPGRS